MAFIIIADNKIIPVGSLTQAKAIRDKEFILEVSESNVYNFVDNQGNLITPEIGSFRVLQVNDFYYDQRKVYIQEIKTGEVQVFSMWIPQTFLTGKLLPLLKTLNKCGSFKNYRDQEHNEMKIRNLQQKIGKLQTEQKNLTEKANPLREELKQIEEFILDIEKQIKTSESEIDKLNSPNSA